MKKIKLIRPIKDAKGENDITEISIKDEKDITAYDYMNYKISNDGTTELGAMVGSICNLCGLTEEQVLSMAPKDYMHIYAEVGKHLG